MRVCFFPHYSFSNRDGATLSMYNIIDELVKRGVEVTVILPNTNHLDDIITKPGVEFIHVPMYSMRMNLDKLTLTSRCKFALKYMHNMRCVNKIVRILKNKNIDVIHINGLDSSVGAKVAQKLNIPYIWHIRQFMEDDLGKKLFHQAETYDLVKQADTVIGISNEVKEKFEKVLDRRVVVIYNGIPQEHYEIKDHLILQGPKINLLLAGRISAQKGQMIAVKAIENLINNGENRVHLTLIGQGETQEYLNQVKNYLKSHNLNNYISLLEHSDNLIEIRRQSDIGLTCSQKEAFGRVTVESMMAGMLTIGANSGGTPEIITDGVNGYLYNVDDPQSLAEVIQKAIDNIETSKTIAKVGYKSSLSRFSIKRVVDEINEIYEGLL